MVAHKIDNLNLDFCMWHASFYLPLSLDPKNCSTFSAVSNTYASIIFKRPCVPPKTHRIWNGRQPPDRLPLSFWRYAWPFKSYRGVKIITFHLHAAPFGIRTPGCYSLAESDHVHAQFVNYAEFNSHSSSQQMQVHLGRRLQTPLV